MENKADTIRQLSKKWLETGDDLILDEMDKLSNQEFYFASPYTRILERYLDATLNVHLHFFRVSHRGVEVEAVNAPELCTVAQRVITRNAPERDALLQVGSVGVAKTGGQFVCAGEGQSQCSVLIDVYEMVKTPEGTQLRRLEVTTEIRLQSLDQCLCLFGNSGEPASLELPLETVRRFTDREHCGRGGVAPVLDNQLPSQVIKRRSEVVKAVTNDDAEAQGRIGKIENKVDSATRVSVLLSNDTALFLVSGDLDSYRIEMVLCPDDFFSDSIKRMFHD